MIFKVSYVVNDGRLPGGIKNESSRPQIGNIIRLGQHDFEIIEIHEVMPPRENFQYLHAIVELVPETSTP